MGTLVRDYVKDLSDDVIIQIIDDQEIFERDGFIGECALRSHASRFMSSIGINQEDHTVLWMQILVTECYRILAHRYLAQTAVHTMDR